MLHPTVFPVGRPARFPTLCLFHVTENQDLRQGSFLQRRDCGRGGALFPAPVGHIGAGAGEGTALGAVGEHGPDAHVVGAAVGGVGVDDVAVVGRPGGEVAAAAVVGELGPFPGGDLHDVDVLSAGRSGAVLAVPGEGEELSVGRPGGRGGVSSVGHLLHAGAVGVHDVELGQAGAVADEGDLGPGLGVVGWARRCHRGSW